MKTSEPTATTQPTARKAYKLEMTPATASAVHVGADWACYYVPNFTPEEGELIGKTYVTAESPRDDFSEEEAMTLDEATGEWVNKDADMAFRLYELTVAQRKDFAKLARRIRGNEARERKAA